MLDTSATLAIAKLTCKDEVDDVTVKDDDDDAALDGFNDDSGISFGIVFGRIGTVVVDDVDDDGIGGNAPRGAMGAGLPA